MLFGKVFIQNLKTEIFNVATTGCKHIFPHPENTHAHTPSSMCSVLKLVKCLKPLAKVYGVIYSKLTIDRAEDTQPHKYIKSNDLQVYTNT